MAKKESVTKKNKKKTEENVNNVFITNDKTEATIEMPLKDDISKINIKDISINELIGYKKIIDILIKEYTNIIQINQGYNIDLYEDGISKLNFIRSCDKKIVKEFEERISDLNL